MDVKQPVSNNKIVNPNVISNSLSAPKDQTASSDNLLEFNLKGVNLKLNQKLPFVMAPKDKKKR